MRFSRVWYTSLEVRARVDSKRVLEESRRNLFTGLCTSDLRQRSQINGGAKWPTLALPYAAICERIRVRPMALLPITHMSCFSAQYSKGWSVPMWWAQTQLKSAQM